MVRLRRRAHARRCCGCRSLLAITFLLAVAARLPGRADRPLVPELRARSWSASRARVLRRARARRARPRSTGTRASWLRAQPAHRALRVLPQRVPQRPRRPAAWELLLPARRSPLLVLAAVRAALPPRGAAPRQGHLNERVDRAPRRRRASASSSTASSGVLTPGARAPAPQRAERPGALRGVDLDGRRRGRASRSSARAARGRRRCCGLSAGSWTATRARSRSRPRRRRCSRSTPG